MVTGDCESPENFMVPLYCLNLGFNVTSTIIFVNFNYYYIFAEDLTICVNVIDNLNLRFSIL